MSSSLDDPSNLLAPDAVADALECVNFRFVSFRLIGLLRETVLAYQSEGSAEARLAAIAALLGPDGDDIVMRCEAHAALAGNNHFLFLARFYHPRRAVLMQALANLNLRSTSQDTSVIEAIAFMLTHRNHRRSELTVAAHGVESTGVV